MRKEEIQDLIRLVEESDISELEVTEGRRKIRISKSLTAPSTGAASVAGSAGAAGAASDPLPAPPAEPRPSDSEALASNLKQITSPMVGTFYRAPAPGSDSFVEIGQAVAVGQTVCIVEAMKLMNEIGSDFDGVVRQVLVENAQPVEYGQPLFLIEMK